ncbi:MAG: hypothetical protein WCC39_06890 [Telluria sp.]
MFKESNEVVIGAPRPAWRKVDWFYLSCAFAALSFIVMWHRWGGTVEDSLAYFNTARYLRAEIPLSALRAPFPYRLAMPALAAYWPGDLRNGYATLNWIATAATATVLSYLVYAVGGTTRKLVLAGLLVTLSVPTFWYAPYLLTDPGAILGRAVFALGVVTGQPWLALAGAFFATVVREENILLLGWLLVFGRVGVVRGGTVLVLAALWLVTVRWVVFPGLAPYVWIPNIGTVIAALRDQRSLLSLFSAGVIVIPMAILGWKNAPVQLRPLKSILLMMALPPLYAALSVRVEGRAIWSLYPFLVPFAVFARLPSREARMHGDAGLTLKVSA